MATLSYISKTLFSNAVFVASFLVSVTLLLCGLFAPPFGVIDNSVLIAVGELLGFGTVGMIPVILTKAGSAKISAGNVSLEIENKENNEK